MQSGSMNIGIVYDVLYPFHMGGAERRFYEIARRLALRGHKVTMLGMKQWVGPERLVRDGVQYVGVSEAVAPFRPTGGRSLREPLIFARGLRRHLARERYDLLDCGEMPYLAACTALEIVPLTTRVVITWHEARGWRGWWQYQGLLGLVAAVWERRLACRARFNVAISDFTADRCRRILRMSRPTVVGCGVTVPSTPPLPLAHRPFQLLHVGRLVPHKQVEWSLRVAARWTTPHPEYRLVIIGTGPNESVLRALARRLGISDRVRFAGAVDEATLQQEYARSRVLLFPSRQEGFGMVALEAMAAGTPVIGLDAPSSAVPHLIRSGENGFLVRSEAEMFDRLQQILEDVALGERLSAGAYRTATVHDWDRAIVPAAERFYRQVAEACHPPALPAKGGRRLEPLSPPEER